MFKMLKKEVRVIGFDEGFLKNWRKGLLRMVPIVIRMKKINITIDWSVVFWISTIIVFLWLLAKAVGLIKTPWFIEAIPYIGGFLALAAVVKEIGKYAQKMDHALVDIGEIKGELKDVKGTIITINTNIAHLDKRVAVLETRL